MSKATLDALEAQLAALPDARDIPNTIRAQETLAEERARLTRCISAIRNDLSTIEECDPLIATLKAQEAALVDVRAELAVELLACPPRSRTREEMDKVQGLTISIRGIDGYHDWNSEAYPASLPLIGKLQARGYPSTVAQPMGGLFGSLKAIWHRLKTLQKRRDEAQNQLDAVLRVLRLEPEDPAPAPAVVRPQITPATPAAVSIPAPATAAPKPAAPATPAVAVK